MHQTTIDAINAILKADATVPLRDRKHFLRELDNINVSNGAATAIGKVPPPTPSGPRLLRRTEVARRLSCSLRLVDRLVEDGALRKIVLPGRQRGAGFVDSEVSALLERKNVK